jgi:hypothetical protein
MLLQQYSSETERDNWKCEMIGKLEAYETNSDICTQTNTTKYSFKATHSTPRFTASPFAHNDSCNTLGHKAQQLGTYLTQSINTPYRRKTLLPSNSRNGFGDQRYSPTALGDHISHSSSNFVEALAFLTDL